MAITIILKFISLLQTLIVVDALMSWFIPPRSNTVSRLLGVVIDPILEPFRKLQERFSTGSIPIDFSPLLAIIFLGLVRSLVISILV